jgi:hypothetical protein
MYIGVLQGECYWRFKGELAYRYGYVIQHKSGLYRMGLWHGDTTHGPLVDLKDIEVRA